MISEFGCTDIITTDTVRVTRMANGDDIKFCLDIPFTQIGNYTIGNDGGTYSGEFAACDIEFFLDYMYSRLLTLAPDGPYKFSWTVEGQVFNIDNVADLPGIVDSMNVIDPSGNWNLATDLLTISGGNLSQNYGDLVIESLTNLSSVTINANEGQAPRGCGSSYG